ncbi:MAG: aminoacyl-tRNA hydrolase [Victivallales bacterium]|nr:aminoacyl-tRNA hydrolase [Victivallales bacterium]
MEKLCIKGNFFLAPDDVEFICTRASGAGGQYVNRTDSAVQLRYPLDLAPEDIRARIHGNISGEGNLLIDAQEHRSQLQNKEAAYARLANILRQAANPPKTRRATKPTKASRLKRLQSKRLHSQKKQLRSGGGKDID